MTEDYIELRSRNSFGDIINLYFEFLSKNLKHYTVLYLRYNAIIIILALVTGYLMVTGFMGLASRDFRFGMGGAIDNEVYLFSGMGLLFLVFFAASVINYSFSSSYVASYIEDEGTPKSSTIWRKIRQNIGTIILFVLIGMAIYFGTFILSIVFAFLPVIGFLLRLGINFLITAILGLSFMSIFFNNKNVGLALTEGWDYTFSNFWKVILYGLVIGFLNMFIIIWIVSIPGYVLSIYTYFSIQSEVEILTSVFANILFTLGFAILILAFIYTQALTQISYGILYYNIYEERNNEYLRKRIEQIGVHE